MGSGILLVIAVVALVVVELGVAHSVSRLPDAPDPAKPPEEFLYDRLWGLVTVQVWKGQPCLAGQRFGGWFCYLAAD